MFLSPGVNPPHTLLLAKLRAKIKSVRCWFASDHVVGSLAQGHLLRGASPFLVLQSRIFQTDRVVKPRQKAMGILHKENRGTLMRHQAVAVNQELITLGFSAKNRMIIQNQAGTILAAFPQK